MAQGAYIGVNGKARKITTGYVGVGNKARKITKAYIGIGSKARPCWNAEKKVTYYGTITPLSVARSGIAATTVGDYALFAGGTDDDYNVLATIDVYNKSLTKSIPTGLSRGRSWIGATTVGNHALFAGGEDTTLEIEEWYTDTVDAYDGSLTRSAPTGLSQERSVAAATTVGDYALFGGSYTFDEELGTVATATVDAYDISLTRSIPTGLSQGRMEMVATTVGDYALFAGGLDSDYELSTTVDAYNKSLTRSTPTGLSQGRDYMAATTVGNYALFGGGFSGWYEKDGEWFCDYLTTADIYDTSLTRSTSTVLSKGRYLLSATTVNEYAIFAGGLSLDYDNGWEIAEDTVDVLDSSLTRSKPTGLSQGKMEMVAATVGNYALFAGGKDEEYISLTTVEAYTVI